MIPCYICGTPRPIKITQPADRTKAQRRACNGHCRQSEIDEVAVQRLVSGQPVRSTRAEREAAVKQLTKHGLSATQIAARIGASTRTVERLRTRKAA